MKELAVGAGMSRVYKLNNKLVINIPFDVAESLGIREGDDLDFFQYSGKSFLLAKKSDIAELLTKLKAGQQAQPSQTEESSLLDPLELALLKKLDTIRYGERTKDKIEGMLSAEEKQTLQKLVRRKFVTLFKKANENEFKYGIERGIYNKFLYGKRTYPGKPQSAPAGRQQAAAAAPAARQPYQDNRRQQYPDRQQYGNAARRVQIKVSGGDNEQIKKLEEKGYVVLRSEAEATSLSAALEESIRQGLVVGTRAFDKKFYIALRDFVGRNAPKLLKTIERKSVGIEDIARESEMEEDGARAVLNILAENGDVTEVRRDVFRAA